MLLLFLIVIQFDLMLLFYNKITFFFYQSIHIVQRIGFSHINKFHIQCVLNKRLTRNGKNEKNKRMKINIYAFILVFDDDTTKFIQEQNDLRFFLFCNNQIRIGQQHKYISRNKHFVIKN